MIWYEASPSLPAVSSVRKEGKTKYIELNGEGTIDEIKDTLLKQLA